MQQYTWVACAAYPGSTMTSRRASKDGKNSTGTAMPSRTRLATWGGSGSGTSWPDGLAESLLPHRRIRKGISVKFQVPGIFGALSVRHNLTIALQHHLQGRSQAEEIARLLAFLNLADAAEVPAGNLSHGQKQWLEIGMAISLRPRLLLLDEPTAGMSPDETHATGEMVQRLNADGMTILAVEHDMDFVRQVAHQVTVLHMGRIFAQGTIAEIMADERVAAIYLGQGYQHV